MAEQSNQIVQKLWNYCNVLRDDGMSYGDYVEQLTYLLFLKMADERAKAPYSQSSMVPVEASWPTLIKRDGDDLFDHYRHVLERLGNEKGLLGLIFNKSQNKFQDPAKLRRLIVDLIDKENWSGMSADVKGDAYEGLLEKNAQDVKTGAGQYSPVVPAAQSNPNFGAFSLGNVARYFGKADPDSCLRPILDRRGTWRRTTMGSSKRNTATTLVLRGRQPFFTSEGCQSSPEPGFFCAASRLAASSSESESSSLNQWARSLAPTLFM